MKRNNWRVLLAAVAVVGWFSLPVSAQAAKLECLVGKKDTKQKDMVNR